MSFQRSPSSPHQGNQQLHQPLAGHHSSSSHSGSVSRKHSIVEMLSSPPPLPVDGHQASIDDFSLSRNTSVSSRASSVFQAGGNTRNDWPDVILGDLAESNKLIAINRTYSVQKAFETLISHNLTSLPVSCSTDSSDLSNCLSFDYSDLNTYLLLIMNKIAISDLCVDDIPDENGDTNALTPQQKHEKLHQLVARAKKGEEVPVDFIVRLHPKTPFVRLKDNESLFKAVESFGNGVHRVAIVDNANKITGILSQRRTIRFLWENARRFPSLEFLLNSSLQDLKIGSTSPITIQGDQPLIEALQKMFDERVSSLAVIDKNKSLVGNISIVDVKNVSSTKNSHLLFKPVTNFISYNLSQKGIERGQDQFPIFHVSQQSSLGRVIAKLVATESHRLWIVETRGASHIGSASGPPSTVEAALSNEGIQPESGRPGKLVGVVTLTDILGLFAHHKSGVKIDPQTARNHRRRSSTSTTRSSIESSHLPSGNTTASTPTSQPHLQPNQDMFRKTYQTGQRESAFEQ
ncbi:hypothetical protein FT663_05161 [Candidozyma haemuli var. vulneris]|uniref:CBS domain-containing protein n=1 Tax=Candidozyma haemuli TaxID=45357 RepID=A0A2V1AND9_9ASCO|nr:hypothetical protein CXQ85_003645 [[Candida] haemuloni]KAF3985241.1 hypothetical protein FT662_05263 [[Candida] haemuloni var. vulneris]KAF3985777.1 hypothetical protein FT663_05161 [[Candida] haemuloni var. vulneris]PVH19787.1 hypothetical protein CXQ85_003645 [[Candida] haemuloni]